MPDDSPKTNKLDVILSQVGLPEEVSKQMKLVCNIRTGTKGRKNTQECRNGVLLLTGKRMKAGKQ